MEQKESRGGEDSSASRGIYREQHTEKNLHSAQITLTLFTTTIRSILLGIKIKFLFHKTVYRTLQQSVWDVEGSF